MKQTESNSPRQITNGLEYKVRYIEHYVLHKSVYLLVSSSKQPLFTYKLVTLFNLEEEMPILPSDKTGFEEY